MEKNINNSVFNSNKENYNLNDFLIVEKSEITNDLSQDFYIEKEIKSQLLTKRSKNIELITQGKKKGLITVDDFNK